MVVVKVTFMVELNKFALQAMASALQGGTLASAYNSPEDCAVDAFNIAEAMMKESIKRTDACVVSPRTVRDAI
jgi:hypothetical protein